jgi:hypothetical protein
MSFLELAKQAEARLCKVQDGRRWANTGCERSERSPITLGLAATSGATAPQSEALAPTPVPALRQALQQWYALTAREANGDVPTPAQARALLSEIRRLWDDVGPAFAEVVSRQEARAYFQETRRCPHCGERGVFHDPGRGSGVA